MVLHDRPEDFRSELEARHHDIVFHWMSALDQVAPALDAFRPDAVFAIRQGGFGGPAHRDAALFPSVRWYHIGGSGYEHLLPLGRSDLCLTNGRGVLAPVVAETAIAGMLALNGNFPIYIDQQRRKEWRPLLFRPIAGQTLLVVGLGAIGREVARRARALGMRILAVSRSAAGDPVVDEVHPYEDLPALLGIADIVTLHVRAGQRTRHLVNASCLAALKRGAILVNTSRGSVVDEDALLAALDSGQVAGVYLDVFEEEPLAPESRLWSHDKVIVTPHAADRAVDWAARMAAFFSESLQLWQTGRTLLNVIPLPSQGT